MNQKKQRSWTLAIFVSITGLVGIASMATMGQLRGYGPRAIADGTAVAALRAAFDEAIPYKGAAVAAMASIRYTLFGDGFPGVLCGEDGWLFSSEEFEEDLGYLEGGFDETVTAVRDRLSERGIALVVAVVPSKTRICASRLGGIRTPAPTEARYGAILSRLESLSVPAVDIASALAENDGGREPFLRSDSHWSQAGSEAAARAVALRVRSMGLELPRAAVRAEITGLAERDGDLMSFMPKRGTTPRFLPPLESLAIIETTVDSGAGLFGSQTIPVAIVGTSYSAEALWNFEGFIKRELSADAINLSVPGKGPFAPMEACLAGTVLTDSDVRLVIWEMPERYVPLSALFNRR